MTFCGPWLEAADVERCSAADPNLPRAILVASELLYMATAQQFPGLCTDKVWPGPHGPAVQWLDYNTGGSRPIAAFGCGCSGGCDGNAEMVGWHQAVKLPGRPVAGGPTPLTITIEGVDFPDYRIVDDQWVIRQDGGPWPCFEHHPDLIDDWSIEYQYGLLPPAAGILAAEVLACELVAGWCEGGDCGPCALPKRLTQLTYEGATISTLDPFTFLDDGRFGITEVDYFVTQYNRNGHTRPGVARSARDFLNLGRRVR